MLYMQCIKQFNTKYVMQVRKGAYNFSMVCDGLWYSDVYIMCSAVIAVMGSQDTCLVSRLSQDMVFHVSVLAQSRHLYVLSWLVSRVSMSRHVSCLMIVS